MPREQTMPGPPSTDVHAGVDASPRSNWLGLDVSRLKYSAASTYSTFAPRSTIDTSNCWLNRLLAASISAAWPTCAAQGERPRL